ncbi:zinc-dependent alcohol dehydrogenase [Cohnella rhizosphaerae]|uniref:Alcohol dehydrogenase catalytic domain-containing protein n=1 Tax=Cohnella rhizosphaerae TaxID=1457232 RepID=A0A9X4QYD6_9BACL|nr:alcohol dehydrogenase catalytic domain-containing protein [Cohnella rhizosphaerae]MDG0814557.1 alcohol dehydrogenase catalytic domain-containing protein [Cohnella rhizosphaerae]
MKALVWTAPEKMEYMDVPKPEPAEDEVLIKVETVGICGSEIEGYLGHNSLRVPPLVMGHEFCGRIESWGARAGRYAAGTKVVVNPLISCGDCAACRKGQNQLCASRRIVGIHRPGAFAEWVAVPVSCVVPVSESLDASRAALAEPLACSLRAARRSMVRHFAPNVLVFGAGGIGLLCAKVARLLGASRVIVADTQYDRLKIALDTGAADRAVHPSDGDLRRFVSEATGGDGADVVIDAAGFQPTRAQAMAIVNPGGTIMNIGLGIDETQLAINHQIRSEIEVLGSFCYAPQDFRDAVRLLEEGRVTEEGWTDRLSVAEGGRAFEDLVRGRVRQGKLFLRMEGA